MLAAQGTAIGVVAVARVERIGEHVVDEAQQRIEGPGESLEHMFASVRIGSDGRWVAQGNLHRSRSCRGRRAATGPGEAPRQPRAALWERPYSDDQISSFVRTRSITASVNSVVPAWPPRSGVLVPEAIVSSADS